MLYLLRRSGYIKTISQGCVYTHEIGPERIITANMQKAPARVVGFFARLRRANGPRDLRSLAIADHL
jgi:hypothetical protein